MVENEPFVCVFCIEKGETQADHQTSNCHQWNDRELSTNRKWDILLKNRACIICFNLGHAAFKCPEKVRSCSNCRVTHGAQLLCKTEFRSVVNESIPDESARENQGPEAHASNRQTPTVPQPKGATGIGKEPEQHVPNAQAEGRKEGGSLYPKINVQEEVRKLECSVGGFFNLKLEKKKESKIELGKEPTKDRTLTFAPSWLKRNLQFGDQFDVKVPKTSEARSENAQENYAPCAPPACDLCRSSCSNSIECWRNLSDLTPTHPPQKLEEMPEETEKNLRRKETL